MSPPPPPTLSPSPPIPSFPSRQTISCVSLKLYTPFLRSVFHIYLSIKPTSQVHTLASSFSVDRTASRKKKSAAHFYFSPALQQPVRDENNLPPNDNPFFLSPRQPSLINTSCFLIPFFVFEHIFFLLLPPSLLPPLPPSLPPSLSSSLNVTTKFRVSQMRLFPLSPLYGTCLRCRRQKAQFSPFFPSLALHWIALTEIT